MASAGGSPARGFKPFRLERVVNMRILLATYWEVPSTTGVGTYIRNIRHGLEALGHTVDILAHDAKTSCVCKSGGSQPVAEHWFKNHIRSTLAAYYANTLKVTDSLVLFRETERYAFELAASLLQPQDYDLVQTHDVISCRALSRLLPRTVPLVGRFGGWLTQEMSTYGQAQGAQLQRYLALEERLGLLSAPYRFVPSHWLKQVFVQSFGLPPETIKVVHSGVRVDEVLRKAAEQPDPAPPADGRLVILCPARLAPYKGQRLLLEAVAEIAKQRRDFVCWLAGEGPMQPALEAQVRDLGIGSHVLFLGNREDVHALMARADLVVLPSLLDSLPHAVQEAQVIGKPVVAFETCGLPEMIVHGDTGLLVGQQTGPALAQALERLLANPDWRRRLGNRAASWGRAHWSAKRMTEETVAIYRDAAEAHRKATQSFPKGGHRA